MTYKLTELLSLSAAPAAGRFPVEELFYDPQNWRVRHVALKAEGWFDNREMLIGIDRFGAPGAETWPIEMSREEVEEAPQWTEAPGTAAYLPPIVIGPFGYTFSPMLMAAEWYAQADRIEGAEPDMIEDETGRKFRVNQASPWIGREITGTSGAGRCADLHISEDWRITHIVTESGELIPADRIRGIAEEGHAVIA